MVNILWPPNGEQPVTKKPEISSDTVSEELKVTISTSTQGASIGYKINNEKTWHVYHQPITLAAGDQLKTKAHRIGYKESETVQISN